MENKQKCSTQSFVKWFSYAKYTFLQFFIEFDSLFLFSLFSSCQISHFTLQKRKRNSSEMTKNRSNKNSKYVFNNVKT